jgi:hypothetical protein
MVKHPELYGYCREHRRRERFTIVIASTIGIVSKECSFA